MLLTVYYVILFIAIGYYKLFRNILHISLLQPMNVSFVNMNVLLDFLNVTF